MTHCDASNHPLLYVEETTRQSGDRAAYVYADLAAVPNRVLVSAVNRDESVMLWLTAEEAIAFAEQLICSARAALINTRTAEATR